MVTETSESVGYIGQNSSKKESDRDMAQTNKLIVNGRVVLPDGVVETALLIKDGKVAALLDKDAAPAEDCEIIDAGGKIVMPGMIDTHNHMGDPGPFNYREDWAHGTRSAASGGITTICDMPLPSEPATVDEPGFAV